MVTSPSWKALARSILRKVGASEGDPMPRLKPKRHRGYRDGEHADEDGTRHFAHGECRDEQEPCRRKPSLRLR
jgi:hypothetical protein